MADETLLKDLMQLDLSDYTTEPYNITTNPDIDKQVLLSDYIRGTTISDEWKTPAQDTLTNDKPGFLGKTLWSFGTTVVDTVRNMPAGIAIAGVSNPISTVAGVIGASKGATAGTALVGKALTKTAGLPKYISAPLNFTGKLGGAVVGGAAGVATVAGAASLLTSSGGSPVNPDTKRRRNVLVYPEETPRNVLANQLYTGELDRDLTPSELVGEATELYAQKEITEEEYTNRLQEAYGLQQKLNNEAVDLLKGRDYPDADVAGSVLSWASDLIQDRRLLRDVQMEQRGQNPNDFSYQAGSVFGSLAPIIAANYLYRSALLRPRYETLHPGSRFRETVVEKANPFTRQQISDKLQNFGKAFVGTQELANYTAQTVSDYIERTGDKDLVYYQPSDIQGLMAGGYAAISAITEYELGGLEDIITGSFKKVGIKTPLAYAYGKTALQEGGEELVQQLEEFLARKIDGTTDKTWGEALKEALVAGVWGAAIGGFVGGTAFKINRANLVKGIMKFGQEKGIKIDEQTATKIADTMMETVEGSLDPKKKDLWDNLRGKISFMMETSDIANKEDRIDAITDLEYALIAADAGFDGIDIENHPLFQGEVNKLGWFRAGIPEESRAVVNDLLNELNDLETQLKTLNEAQDKDWEKIDEIERKLEMFDRYVLDKLGENAPASLKELDNELRKVENKYVNKEKKKKGIKVPTDAIFESLPDKNFDTTQKYTADKPYKYTSDGNNFQYYDDGIHHIVQLLDKDGKILSSIEIAKQAKDVSYIQTEPEYKRKGFGTILLKESERLFGNKMKAKPSPTVEAIEFWKKNGYTRDIGDGMVAKETEPTISEEKEAVKQAADVADGTITTGTPEPVAEIVIQDYGEKIEGAKKDIVGKGVSSETLTDIDKIMKKAPKSETSKQILRNWLEQQDPEFVAQIRQLNLPIRVSKTLEYRRVLAEAFTQHPELNMEADRYDVLAGTEELSQETLDKYSIVPEYDFYYKTTDDNYVKLTPENVAARIEGRGALQFSYSKSTRGVYFLWAKKGSGSWIPLIEFGSMEEMDEHRNNHTQEDREKIYQEMTSFKDNRKEKVIRERVGTDYRNGKNVTEEQFAKQFGFRGVQFGNYENQEKRQKEINNSYDSFMDLANILGLPPKAISLGGTLGIAFGARGSGSALAHYEPDLKVINITRDAGAGALAHEWFHALDNYLAQNLSQYANMTGGGWITKSDNYYYYKVNEELSNSLKEYIRAIKNEKAFQLRLRQLGQYWKRDWEVAARLFEQYVSAKVAEQNGINDYLANPQKYYISSSPYLTLEESQRVFPKLENMLNSIKTREEDGNVVLYQDNTSLLDRAINPRWAIPKVRGGWTKEKILRYLKSVGSYSGAGNAAREIANFDSVEDFKNHVFYHGSRYGTSGGMQPSITMSDRKVERIGGGGYGEKYWAISLTKSKRVAGNIGTAMGDGRIYPVLLVKNAKVIEMPELTDSADLDDHIVDLYEKGVDAVWIGDKNAGEQELAVINPKAIINIGTPEFYNAFGLGTEKNPIRMNTEEDFRKIYDFAKEYRNKDKETRIAEARAIVRWQNRPSGAAPSTYRGAYIPQYRFIQRTNKMDASTLSHELAHDWFEINFDKFRSGKASKEFMRAWGALEKALGITDKSTKADKASEAFARAYEGWIMNNKGWEKLINVDDKDRDDIIKLMLDYQSDLRDIYQDLTHPYFKQTWGKLGEMKPEIKAWFDKVVNITDIDKLVERGEMTPEQATQEKLNQAIDTVIENTENAETKKTLETIRVLNDTKRYEAEGGNKNALQVRLANLAQAIDENNMLIKENYDTHRDMLEVAKQADNFVKTRLEDALAIINGQMAEQEGLFKEDIYTALERLALENGDLNLLDELKNSEVANRLAKELGQRVAGFRNWNAGDMDIVSSLKALDNKFNKALKNKKAQAQMAEAEQMFAKAQEQQDKMADKQLDSFLKDIECK